MMEWKNQRVVVTGGAGMIGSHLVEALVERGALVRVYDDFSRGKMENLSRVVHKIDGHNIDLRYHYPGIGTSDIVFHLAARVSNIEHNRAHNFEMFYHNSLLTNTILNAVRRGRPKLFVAVSTVCVYPHDAQIPTLEKEGKVCNPEPTNHGYGVAKWVLEQGTRYLCDEEKIPSVVVRFANAIGPRDYYDWESSHVIPAFIRKAHELDKLIVWGSGEQSRTFVDSRDISTALIKLAENPAAHDAQPINIGHYKEVTMLDLAKMILKFSGKDIPIELDTTKPDGHKRRLINQARLRTLIGWTPDTPLEKTIKDMIAEFQAGKSWL